MLCYPPESLKDYTENYTFYDSWLYKGNLDKYVNNSFFK